MAELRGRRAAQLAIVAAVALISLLLLPRLAMDHGNFDARIYRGAVAHWVSGGDLYSYGVGERHLGFTYPPFAALVMVPMTFGPQWLFLALNQLVILVALVLVIRLAIDWLPAVASPGLTFMTAVAVPLALLLQPVRDTLTFGQVNLALAALVLVDLALLDRGSRWAGVGVGLATAIKLTPGLFLVFLLVAGARKAAGTAAATAVAVTLLAAAVAPHASWAYWTSALYDGSRVGSYDSATNQSLGGVLARVANSDDIPAVWLPLVVLLVAVGLWRAGVAWRDEQPLAAFTIVGLTAALASPISWIHHLVWVVPAVLVVLDAGLRKRSAALVGLAATLFVFFAAAVPDQGRAHAGHHHSVRALVGENGYAVALFVLVLLLPTITRAGPPYRTEKALSGVGADN